MRRMWFLGIFVANFAKERWKVERADSQCNNAYPSFIVRLSFVIGSFILRDSCMVLGGVLLIEWFDYQGIWVEG